MKNISRREFGKISLAGISGLLIGCGSDTNDSMEETNSNESSAVNKRPSFRHRRQSRSQENYTETAFGINQEMIWIPEHDVEHLDYRQFSPNSPAVYKGSEPFIEHVEGFWIGKTEITISAWFSFLEASNYDAKSDTHQGQGGAPEDIRNPALPATYLSAPNAKRFVDYLTLRSGLNYNLPTPAEWVLACRGPKMPPEGLYGKITSEESNLVEFGSEDLLPVKSLKPNRFGLYHMIGNASEFLTIPSEKLCPEGIKHVRKDNTRMKDLIFLSPDRTFRMEEGSYNFGVFPQRFRDPYAYSDRRFNRYTGFRIIRRPSEQDQA